MIESNEELSVSLRNRNINRYIDVNRSLKKKNVKVAKCKWCGTFFVREYAPQKYCCDSCRGKSRKLQSRMKSHRWYHRHKHELSEKQRWGLGSGWLGSHRNHDFEKESNIIHNELSRLKLSKK